jgi:hypothetical protein
VWGNGNGAGEVVYVAGDQGLILRHDMLGWAQEAKALASETLTALFGSNEDNLYTFGNKGGMFRRLGGLWQPASAPPIGPGVNGVSGCMIPSTPDLLAVGDQGTIVHRMGSWVSENSLTLQPFSGVSAAALNDYYIVGANGLILHKY